MRNTFTLLLLCTLSFSVTAAPLPPQSTVPGGIAHILINSEASPNVTYRGHSVMVINTQGTTYAAQSPWVALVGIPLSAKPPEQTLIVNGKKQFFQIHDKQYKEQHITIENKRKVNPTPLDMDRIGREKKEILQALASWTLDTPPVTELLKPAQGPYSSPFGLKRFFNEQPRKPHSGIDIAAPKGSPIIAPAAGTVVATGDYFFNGNTVILDHGHGLTTLYCHMDKVEVVLGQKVALGETLGTIGSTGRATGPHLHWGVSLNNARINPFLLIKE